MRPITLKGQVLSSRSWWGKIALENRTFFRGRQNICRCSNLEDHHDVERAYFAAFVLAGRFRRGEAKNTEVHISRWRMFESKQRACRTCRFHCKRRLGLRKVADYISYSRNRENQNWRKAVTDGDGNFPDPHPGQTPL